MRIFLAFILAMTLFTPPAAQAESNLLFGAQTHSYTVVMRGNGEAIVYGKIEAPNADDVPMDRLRLTLNVSDAEDFVAYQEIAVTSRQSEYKKITAELVSAGTYDLKFPLAIDPDGKTEITFAYSSMQFTEKGAGLFRYTFTTPSVESRVENITVSISTDSDLYIKGSESRVKYQESYAEVSALSTGFADTSDMQRSVRYIGSGRVTERASNLQPGESFTVDGTYSEHEWRLSLSKILWSILGAVVAGTLAYFIVRRARLAAPSSPVLRAPHAASYGLLSALMIGTWTAFILNIDFDFIRSNAAEALSAVLVGLVYLACAFIPSIVIGARNGWQSGVRAFLFTILFLVLGIVTIVLFGGQDTIAYAE